MDSVHSGSFRRAACLRGDVNRCGRLAICLGYFVGLLWILDTHILSKHNAIEWNIDTIYEKAHAATGIPIDEQVLTFGGRTLNSGKKLTSYGVQHGSEIVLKTKSGAVVQSRQGRVAANRRDIKVTRGKQSI